MTPHEIAAVKPAARTSFWRCGCDELVQALASSRGCRRVYHLVSAQLLLQVLCLVCS